MKANNQGLTFIWIPNLFSKVPAGSLFLALFFLALCFAAFSSLISQLELVTRILIDAGLSRKRAVGVVGVCCFIMGLPSALSIAFFGNQDWVWGLGLIVSGSFFTIAVLKTGPKRFREEIIAASNSEIHLGKAFDILIKFFLPLQALAMLVWKLAEYFFSNICGNGFISMVSGYSGFYFSK